MLLSSIPSPGFKTLDLGPLHLRMYGTMIAIGALAAVTLARRRWQARGGDPNDVNAIAMWAIPAGIIGARLYHVTTDWRRYDGHWIKALYIWNGGLGIPGGVIAGVLAGVVVAKRRHLPVPDLMDVVAPAFPLAQAIGQPTVAPVLRIAAGDRCSRVPHSAGGGCRVMSTGSRRSR